MNRIIYYLDFEIGTGLLSSLPLPLSEVSRNVDGTYEWSTAGMTFENWQVWDSAHDSLNKIVETHERVKND